MPLLKSQAFVPAVTVKRNDGAALHLAQMGVSGSITIEERCGRHDWSRFFVLLLSAAVETDVRAVAGLLDPTRAAAAFLLCRSKQEQHTADKHTQVREGSLAHLPSR